MAADLPGGGELEVRVVEALEDREAAELRDLIEATGADAGSVFACVRRLERQGVLESPHPGVYSLTESGLDLLSEDGPIASDRTTGTGDPDAPRGHESGGRANPGRTDPEEGDDSEGTPKDGDGERDEPDDFEWLG